jgi:hypothetical protein
LEEAYEWMGKLDAFVDANPHFGTTMFIV